MENGDEVQSNLILQGGQPTKGRIVTTAEVLPKEEGVQALHQAPRPGGSVPGRQTSRTWL